ncbi:unnamed protein product [Brassica oleracea]
MERMERGKEIGTGEVTLDPTLVKNSNHPTRQQKLQESLA